MPPTRGPIDRRRCAKSGNDEPEGDAKTPIIMMRLPDVKATLLPGLCLAVVTIAQLPNALAIDAGPIAIHGSISATASYSGTYNYLGDTRDRLDLNLVDVVLNGTHRFENGLRVGAQIYAFTIDDYNSLTLDWASLDYSFTPALGVRVGRNKMQFGLYNDSQDLDAIRTFASMPWPAYPKPYRAVTASMDGLTLYGALDMGKGGSLDYQLFGGAKETIDGDSPFIGGINNLARYDSCEFKRGVYGGSLFWNTPFDGLRIGYSYLENPKNVLDGVVNEMEFMRGSYLALARQVDGAFGTGTWDNSGLFAGTSIHSHAKARLHAFSAEYTHDKWLLAAEYKRRDETDGVITVPAIGVLGLPTTNTFAYHYEQYYGMVTYQATDQIGCGVYYAYENTARGSSSSDPLTTSKDWAAAISYAPNEYWIFKVEGHLVDGRSLVYSAGDDNRTSGTDRTWTYLVLKTTFSF